MKIAYGTAKKVALAALVFVLLFCLGVFAQAGQGDAVMFVCLDAELGKSEASGGASLKGAGISIWRQRADQKTFVQEFRTDETGKVIVSDLPEGRYLAKHTAPSRGYRLDKGFEAVFTVSKNGEVTLTSGFSMRNGSGGFPCAVIRQQVKRADLKYIRHSEDPDHAAGIPIKLTLLSMEGEELESHVYVTDETGTIDTGLDEYCFGGNRQVTDRDGALVFGLYRITDAGQENEENEEKHGTIFYSDADGNPADPMEYFENGITYTFEERNPSETKTNNDKWKGTTR